MSEAHLKQILIALYGSMAWLGLHGTVLVLALALPRLRARTWLVASAITLLVVQLWHTVGQLVLVSSYETYRDIWQPAWPLSSTLVAAGTALFILFVYEQRTDPHDHLSLGDILFRFHGRVARRHYWLGSTLIGFVCWVPAAGMLGSDTKIIAYVAYGLSILAFAWPSLALQVQRWHDRGKSGWMVLINFIPVVGTIWAIIELGCLPGTPGPNAYGENPIAVCPQPHSPELAPPTPPPVAVQP